MIEYTHFVLAGIEMGKHFIESLPAACVQDGDLGDVDYLCWRKGFFENFADRYSNMPFMVEYI